MNETMLVVDPHLGKKLGELPKARGNLSLFGTPVVENRYLPPYVWVFVLNGKVVAANWGTKKEEKVKKGGG